MRTMRTLLFACLLALPAGALLFGLHGANAQGSPDVRQACTPDAMRLCSEFIPDAERVKRCMLARRAQLSEGCRMAMRGGGGRVAERHGRHRYRHHGHCRTRHGHRVCD